MNINKKLDNKVAIITGGSRGIGRAIALAFAKEGAKIVIFAREKATIENVVKEIKKIGCEAIGISGNVGSSSDINRMMGETLEKFGTVDILINNAGGASEKSLLEMSEEDWDIVINSNLKGPFLCSQAVARVMIDQKKGGRIINISSVLGLRVRANFSAYQSAKGGLNLLTRSLGVELIPYGIYVNGIAPGTILTRLAEEDVKTNYKALMDRCPAKRIGKPEEVAELVLFLATEQTKFIVGEVIYIDGGQTIRE